MSQSAENTRKAAKLIRSATDPATSATVMTAKVIWYIMNRISGMVLAKGLTEFMPMPVRNHLPKEPI